MLRLLIPAALAVANAAAFAQPDAHRPEGDAGGVLATLVTPNGDMRLTLTSRSLSVGFTSLGHRRIRRAADSAFAATRVPYGAKGAKLGRPRPGRADDVPATPGDATADSDGDESAEKPDKPIPLRDVEAVRASGDSLLLCFTAHPGPGPAAPPCSMWRRFLVTGLPPADARRFAEAVRRARARSLGAPS